MLCFLTCAGGFTVDVISSTAGLTQTKSYSDMFYQPCLSGRALLAGSMLLTASIFAQTVTNPSFEADTFTVAPGTVSANSPITGWTVADPTRAGLTPAGALN